MRKINSHLRFAGAESTVKSDRQAYNIYVQGARAFETKDFAAAVEYLSRATELNPKIEKGWMFLAFSLFMLENYEECEKAVDNCLQIVDNPFMVHLKGKLMLIFQKYSAAERYFRHAYELAPGELEFTHDLAEYLYAIGKYEDAAIYYSMVLKTNYSDIYMLLSYSHCLMRKDETEIAAEIMVKLLIEHAASVQIRDEIIKFFMNIPESFAVKDKLFKEMMSIAGNKYDNNELVFLTCGMIYSKMQSYDNTTIALELYAEYSTDQAPEILNMLAMAHIQQGNRERAMAVLTSAAEKWGDFVPNLVQLGIMLAEDGNFADSDEVMQRARDISPNSKVVKNAEHIITKNKKR
jgi:tetratricopeptide (TPR) repeat protein